MKKTNILIKFITFCLLASCMPEGTVTSITNVIYNDAQEESADFVSESLLFYKHSNTPTDVFYARFYNGEHYVPYVSIRYYLEAHDVFNLSKTSYSDGKYSYEYKVNGKSFPITIDVKNDTINCAEWAGFIDETNGDEDDEISNKMVKVLKKYSGQKARIFDLKKYGMEIYGGIDDAYVPLCVLNQLFTARNYKEIIYNGQGVYFLDMAKDYTYENYKKSPWYMSDDGSVCTRPKKLIDLTYNMLCFVHDNCYGHPGYYGFADNGNGYPNAEKVSAADALSFDEMLSEYGSDVKTMLKSSDYFEYVKGLSKLLYFTYGDSHTAALYAGPQNYMPNFTQSQMDDFMTFLSENNSMKAELKSGRDAALKEERRKVTGRTDSEGNTEPFYVLSGGKTAVFTFDSFAVDIDFWKSYYKSTHVTAEPNPDNFALWGLTYNIDPTLDFYKAIYKLLNDNTYSAVETILIDVSCNGGGDDRCLKKLFAYMLDFPDFRQYDIHTDTKYENYIYADLNLDGKIDDDDASFRSTISNKFKFAVLASRRSFSCGNALPAVCADEGIPVIGEQSGGGACVVGLSCTADGLPYQFSSNSRISHKSDWSTIESGAPITSGGEITEASDFYNDTKLQQIIDSVVN